MLQSGLHRHEARPPPPLPLPAQPTTSASPAAPVAPPSAPATSLSLSEKLKLIKVELVLPPGLPMAATVSAANEQMGLSPDGLALPAQVERLLDLLGLPKR